MIEPIARLRHKKSRFIPSALSFMATQTASKITVTKYPAWPDAEMKALVPTTSKRCLKEGETELGPIEIEVKQARKAAKDFHAAAFYYEYARESHTMRETVAKWRSKHKKPSLDVLLAPLAEALSGTGVYSKKWHKARALVAKEDPSLQQSPHVVPTCFLASFPEFPEKPWYLIPDTPMRKYWAEILRWRLVFIRDFSELYDPEKSSRDVQLATNLLIELRKEKLGVILLQFDWTNVSNEEVIKSVEEWLNTNRPESAKVVKKFKRDQRHFLGQPLRYRFGTALRRLDMVRKMERAENPKTFVIEQGLEHDDKKIMKLKNFHFHAEKMEVKKVIQWFDIQGTEAIVRPS